MSELATRETDRDPTELIQKIEHPVRREDSFTLLRLMHEITGETPRVWGDRIIGFGKYTYRRKGSKKEYDWFPVGFAPGKNKITLYVSCYLTQYEDLLRQLGKCKWGKGCLYISKLADVDMQVLRQFLEKTKDARWHQS